MSTMMIVIVLAVVVVLAVLALSILTINKGYSYKHTIDPPKDLPPDETRDKK
ncbi:YtzI protein [Domibacillus indicus]|uniref:YtzI protein n=1 Tax=Domibacillus indicus TaxID=1437523 RepID=UPI000B1C956B|nr:YtzI protein [Domibacillus indicus]